MTEHTLRAVKLIGGRFDGSVVVPSELAMAHGCIVICECKRHGVNPQECECDDAVLYGYFAEPGNGCGQYALIGEG